MTKNYFSTYLSQAKPTTEGSSKKTQSLQQTVLHPPRTVAFTGHEKLTSMPLVHMSAEVYGAISLVATTFQLTIAFDVIGQNVG